MRTSHSVIHLFIYHTCICLNIHPHTVFMVYTFVAHLQCAAHVARLGVRIKSIKIQSSTLGIKIRLL